MSDGGHMRYLRPLSRTQLSDNFRSGEFGAFWTFDVPATNVWAASESTNDLIFVGPGYWMCS